MADPPGQYVAYNHTDLERRRKPFALLLGHHRQEPVAGKQRDVGHNATLPSDTRIATAGPGSELDLNPARRR